MILSNQSIKKKMQDHVLEITPITDTQYQPASVDLRLGNHFLSLDESSVAHLSLEKAAAYKEVFIEKILIPPMDLSLLQLSNGSSFLEMLQLLWKAEVPSADSGCSSKMQDGSTPGLKGILHSNFITPTKCRLN